jgi:tryptophan-rich sensory protein
MNKLSFNKKNIIKLFLSMFIGYVVSIKCKMNKSSGSSVRFRPPSFIFGIVWPILYLLIGFSWIQATDTITENRIDALYISLSLLLGFWIIVYACMENKLRSLYIMFIIILNLLFLMILVPEKSKLLLAPLCIWLLYATFLLTTDIQNTI